MAHFDGQDHRAENLALAVLAVLVALILAYAMLMRPDSGTSGEAELARAMPENYKPVLAALVRASGHECDQVCAASVTEPLLGSTHVRVACTVAAKNAACETAHEFEISARPVAEPSR